MKTRVINEDQEELLKNRKHTVTELVEIIGCHEQTIYAAYKRLGLKPISDQRKYIPKDDFFKTWTREMAYILGLIASDGYVITKTNSSTYWGINLQEDDIEVLENVKKHIKFLKPLYTRPTLTKTQKVLVVFSKEMVSDLRNFGFYQDKSYSLKWPNQLPQEFVTHFIRGYFDGDGSIYATPTLACNIVGTRSFIESVKNEFEKIRNIPEGHIATHTNGFSAILYYNGPYIAREFLDWIYKDSTPETRMARKYDLYVSLSVDLRKIQAPNNAIISDSVATDIRTTYHSDSVKVKDLAKQNNITEATVYDILGNRSWIDKTYTPIKGANATKIMLLYQDKEYTIQELSDATGVPYSTIDRRIREGRSVEEAIKGGRVENRRTEDGRGKALSIKDLASYEVAKLVRQGYKDGIRGKAAYEKFNIPKSRYIDLIGNRTVKEDIVWWKTISS